MGRKILSIVLVLAMLTLCGCDQLAGAKTSLNNFIKTIDGEPLEEEMGEDTIKIGVLEPQSGKYVNDAAEELKGIKLANKMFPTVLDKKVELVYADSQSDPKLVPDCAQALIDSGCKIILGSYNNVLTMAACDILEENEIVCICPSCTNPLITTTTRYFFRVAVVEAFQGNSAAKYVIEHLPREIHDNVQITETVDNVEGKNEDITDSVKCLVLKKAGDDKASALIERFQAKMEEQFGDNGYARVIEYPANAEDMTPFFERLKEAGAEVVFFPSSAVDGEKVLFEAYSERYNFTWVGDSDWSGLQLAAEEALRENQNHLEGVAFVAAFDKQSAATNMTTTFLSSAQAYYGEATPSENMALGFDAYVLALQGIADAGSVENGEKLRLAINKFYEVECATGKITYRAGNGDPVKDVVIEKIQDGQIKADYTAVPVWEVKGSK